MALEHAPRIGGALTRQQVGAPPLPRAQQRVAGAHHLLGKGVVNCTSWVQSNCCSCAVLASPPGAVTVAGRCAHAASLAHASHSVAQHPSVAVQVPTCGSTAALRGSQGPQAGSHGERRLGAKQQLSGVHKQGSTRRLTRAQAGQDPQVVCAQRLTQLQNVGVCRQVVGSGSVSDRASATSLLAAADGAVELQGPAQTICRCRQLQIGQAVQP